MPTSPLRFCPAPLLAKKQSEYYTAAWCIAVKPKYGPWEGYTSWDKALSLPFYADLLGNAFPAMVYQPSGAELTNIPTQLKLGSQAADMRMFAPRKSDAQNYNIDPVVYLDREKVLAEYYDGAFWAIFELDPEDLASYINLFDMGMFWFCGEMGQIQNDDVSATAELTTYDEIANRDVGEQLHTFCQVGSIRGEDFGLGRCRCEIGGIVTGIRREDWTVEAIVQEGSTASLLRVLYGDDAISGEDLPALFESRMPNGAILFVSAVDGGGKNANILMPVRDGAFNDGAFEVIPKLSLPFAPLPGDVIRLTAGCKRTKDACDEVDNLPRMRAQDLPGNDDLNRRTIT